MTGTEPHAWETGLMDTITYVGLDVHKATISVALAEGGRGGEGAASWGFRKPSRDSDKTGGAAEHGRPWSELLLRGRPLRLRVAPIADRLWT